MEMPAKSFEKGVTSQFGYCACNRCEVRGIDHQNRSIFTDALLRANESFRNRSQREYHIISAMSPFEYIENSDLIRFFPFDYMHLLCIWLTVRLLEILRTGPVP